MSAIEKEFLLIKTLQEMKQVAIAFSGGVDSTYLAAITQRTLNDKAIAFTIKSEYISDYEVNEAVNLAKIIKIKHKIINIEALKNKNIAANTLQRCFYCKTEMYKQLIQIAHEYNFPSIIDGSNTDDQKEDRPGLIALNQLGIRSPLAEIGLTKDEIRILSKQLGLPTWDKPSFSCLATSIPYGESLSLNKFDQLEKAEIFLRQLQLKQFRVRHHELIARIEVNIDGFNTIIINREKIIQYFKELGFTYITLDLEGYRFGSLKEAIQEAD